METTSPSRSSVSPRLWLVLALLALSLLINYIDRSSLSTAAPLIKGEFALSSSQLGVLFSAFSWTYAFFLILSGWLADRYRVNIVLAVGFAVWSAATLLTGFSHGFLTFLVLRLMLGIGESVAYPCYSRILVRHYPERHRGLANSIIGIGMPGGLAVGTFTGAILMAHFGWRPFFVVLGVATMLWLVPWLIWMPRTPGLELPASQSNSTPVLEILQQPSLWGTCAALFTLDYVLYFMVNWLPTYLVQGRHFAMSKVAVVGFVYLTGAVATPLAGWLSDLWIASGATPTLARKAFMIAGQSGCALSLAACVVSGPRFTLALLLIAGLGFGCANSQTWAISQTLAGPNASGNWTGVQNFFGNWAGIAGPVIAGVLVDRTGGFFWAFITTALIGIVGCAVWLYGVGPLRPIQWRGAPPAALRDPI
jgi:MFS family permease